jgi:hypothetical protein
MLFLVKKFHGEKRSVRRSVAFMQQRTFLALMFGAKSSHVLKQTPQNVIVVCGNDCVPCLPGQIPCEQSSEVKEN